ncbi:hypothetical protein [Oceanispirochaeta sp.]|jgi:hypothetical protein|nr:hypothetical protein [Oceanispirochaeta sp.]MDA3957067.1 hypothetical protein [Oceanispirochaeta sp.]
MNMLCAVEEVLSRRLGTVIKKNDVLTIMQKEEIFPVVFAVVLEPSGR